MPAADVREELAALKRQLDDLEAESRANAGTLATAIRKTRNQVVQQELRRSVEKLRPPTSLLDWSPRKGNQSDPALQDSLLDRLRRGDPVADSIGNVSSYIGRTNLLADPLFDAFPVTVTAVTTSPQKFSPGWRIYYELVSGIAPNLGVFAYLGSGPSEAFGSSAGEVYAEWNAVGAASEIKIYFESQDKFPQLDYPTLPYVVAFGALTRFTGGTAPDSQSWLELITDNGVSITVLATSRVYTYDEWGNNDVVEMLATVPYDASYSQILRFRWVCRVVRPATTARQFYADLGDPMLSFAYTPDPPAQNPVLGHWVPPNLRNRYMVDDPYDLINAARSTDAAGIDRFRARDTAAAGVVFQWGGGAVAPDTNLYRAAADVLATDDHLQVGRRLRMTGLLSPAQITADQNNYNPTGFADANLVRLRSDATVRTITGMVAGAAGDLVILCNVNTGTAMTLSHQNAASTAANRFFGPNSADVTLRPGGFVWCVYDSVSTGWRIMGQ